MNIWQYPKIIYTDFINGLSLSQIAAQRTTSTAECERLLSIYCNVQNMKKSPAILKKLLDKHINGTPPVMRYESLLIAFVYADKHGYEIPVWAKLEFKKVCLEVLSVALESHRLAVFS